jgi:hypothetical protein
MVLLAKLISGASGRWMGCVPDTRQRIYCAAPVFFHLTRYYFT